MSEALAPAAVSTERHPRGLYVLAAAETWERFSFYSMTAMFALYLRNPTQGFGWSAKDATSLYSTYVMLVYFSPLLGGWLADRFLGYRRSVIVGGFFFMAGHLLLAFRAIEAVYAAITCLVIGNGFFKPNVSTMVGNLYSQGSEMKDRAFSIFYMGINVGALTAPIVAEWIAPNHGFHVAFTVAAAGMVVSVAILMLGKRFIEAAGERRAKPVEAASAVRHPIESVPDWKRVTALLAIYAVGIVFWMVFWQNGSTLTYWADDNTDWKSIGADFTGIISNAINPAWIVALGAPMAWLWGWMNRRGIEPATPTKMAFGLLAASASAFVMYFAAVSGGYDVAGTKGLDGAYLEPPSAHPVSPFWLIGAYFAISIGELLLSAMGLSLVSKVAPPRWRGLMMGGWFVSLSLGGKLSVIGVYWTEWSHAKFFAVLGALSLGATALLFVCLRFLRKSMPGV